MKLTRRAVIDIGTNSVKLLVADVAGHQIIPWLETSEQTRLGRGFYESHQLQPEPIRQTARAVAAFAEEARRQDAGIPRIVATSAARDATNAGDLIGAVHRETGLSVEIVSGEHEAELVFQGVTSDPSLEGQRLLIMDAGGGSTEFILGEKGRHAFRQSFPVGSVRLLELLRPRDPPTLDDLAGCRAWLHDYFHREINPRLAQLLDHSKHGEIRLVGTGGTTSILARMEHRMAHYRRDLIEGTRLSRRRILDLMVHLWALPLAERRRIQGLPSNRADIILMGVAIYEAVVSHLHFQELLISTRGLRFGVLLESG